MPRDSILTAVEPTTAAGSPSTALGARRRLELRRVAGAPIRETRTTCSTETSETSRSTISDAATERSPHFSRPAVSRLVSRVTSFRSRWSSTRAQLSGGRRFAFDSEVVHEPGRLFAGERHLQCEAGPPLTTSGQRTWTRRLTNWRGKPKRVSHSTCSPRTRIATASPRSLLRRPAHRLECVQEALPRDVALLHDYHSGSSRRSSGSVVSDQDKS